MRPLRTDGRGVTVPMNYALMLTVVALLTAVLVAGMGAYVDDQQDRSARAGLEVVGNRIAADLTTADQLAGSVSGDGAVEVRTDLPETVAGTTYRVELVLVSTGPDANRYDVVLTGTDPAVTVSVPVRTRLPVEPTGFAGGGTRVTYDDGSDTLEVGRA